MYRYVKRKNMEIEKTFFSYENWADARYFRSQWEMAQLTMAKKIKILF